MNNEKYAESRKPYEKPVVTRFPLRAEEAVRGDPDDGHRLVVDANGSIEGGTGLAEALARESMADDRHGHRIGRIVRRLNRAASRRRRTGRAASRCAHQR